MSDPRPEPIQEPERPFPPEPEEDENGDDEDDDDLAARAANRAACKRLYPDVPCISILAADRERVVETYDCVGWCPVLKKRV